MWERTVAISQELVEITATDVTHGGEAIGRHEGKVVFLPYVLPGERARVRIVETKKHYLRGALVELLEPSPQRVTPPCRHFGECGGCQWQHIAYEAQLAYKQRILRDQLARLAGLSEVPIAPVLGMEIPWNYRNDAQFTPDAEGNLGYLAARSHRVVAIEECYLLHPFLEEMLVALDLELPNLKRLSLRAGVNTGDQMFILETEDDEIPELEVDFPVSGVFLTASGSPITLVGRDYLYERIGGRQYRISAPSFFQVNTEQAEELVRLVGEALAPEGSETLLDLYCGVGTFGLALVDRVSEIIGVEENPYAVEDAMANAEGDARVTIFPGRVEDVLPSLGRPVHLAIVDPPRGGMEQKALQALANLSPRRIAYVSCDPATLARDAKLLTAAGYAVRQVWPVDMFPQTYHIESVTLLEK